MSEIYRAQCRDESNAWRAFYTGEHSGTYDEFGECIEENFGNHAVKFEQKDCEETPKSVPTTLEESQSKPVNTNTTTTQKSSSVAVKVEKDLPKAMIKPNVLTHVIEDFIIQEANEPFAVTRQRYSDKESLEEPPKKRQALEENIGGNLPSDTVACEHCGKQELRSKLKKKRFCSLNCARASKSTPEPNLDCNSTSISEELKTASTTQSIVEVIQGQDAISKVLNGNFSKDAPVMMQWTVSDVCEFIKNLPGCSDYADDFAIQEIDGQALLLLKENHLVNAMGMKLGPALKIVAKIGSMKESSSGEKDPH